MRWASDDLSRPLVISGEWKLPTFGAAFHKNKVEALAKPDENAQPNYSIAR